MVSEAVRSEALDETVERLANRIASVPKNQPVMQQIKSGIVES